MKQTVATCICILESIIFVTRQLATFRQLFRHHHDHNETSRYWTLCLFYSVFIFSKHIFSMAIYQDRRKQNQYGQILMTIFSVTMFPYKITLYSAKHNFDLELTKRFNLYNLYLFIYCDFHESSRNHGNRTTKTREIWH